MQLTGERNAPAAAALSAPHLRHLLRPARGSAQTLRAAQPLNGLVGHAPKLRPPALRGTRPIRVPVPHLVERVRRVFATVNTAAAAAAATSTISAAPACASGVRRARLRVGSCAAASAAEAAVAAHLAITKIINNTIIVLKAIVAAIITLTPRADGSNRRTYCISSANARASERRHGSGIGAARFYPRDGRPALLLCTLCVSTLDASGLAVEGP